MKSNFLIGEGGNWLITTVLSDNLLNCLLASRSIVVLLSSVLLIFYDSSISKDC